MVHFLFSTETPAEGLTLTAHGDGRVRAGANGTGRLPEGHGIVQRAGTRRTIDLASNKVSTLTISGLEAPGKSAVATQQ